MRVKNANLKMMTLSLVNVQKATSGPMPFAIASHSKIQIVVLTSMKTYASGIPIVSPIHNVIATLVKNGMTW